MWGVFYFPQSEGLYTLSYPLGGGCTTLFLGACSLQYAPPPMQGLHFHPPGSLYIPLKVYTHNHQVLEDIELALIWAAAISKYGTLNTCEPSLNLGIRITLLRVLSLGCRTSSDCLDLSQVLQATACHPVEEVGILATP